MSGEGAVKVIGVCVLLGNAVRDALFEKNTTHGVVGPCFGTGAVTHARAAADGVCGRKGGKRAARSRQIAQAIADRVISVALGRRRALGCAQQLINVVVAVVGRHVGTVVRFGGPIPGIIHRVRGPVDSKSDVTSSSDPYINSPNDINDADAYDEN